jgi:hypothetical protein
VLYQGEFGLEVDTNKIKLGDGTTHWVSLPYVSLNWATLTGKPTYIAAGSTKSAARSAIDAEGTTAKGQANGYASLDSSGLVPTAQLPITQAAWDTLEGKPTVVAAGTTKGAAREAIDAEYIVTAGSTGQYYRGDKSWQTLDKSAAGLANVDNTSDSTKNSATATLTNKTISGADNTLSSIPQSAVTNLSTDLGAKQSTSEKGQANGYASLDGGGKVPVAQLPNSIMEYQGLWNAATNAPTLVDGTGSPGDVYRVSTAGSQNLGAGSIAFAVGDYVIYSPATSAWEKADTTDAVTTVNGYSGSVSLGKSDVGLGNVDNTSDSTKDAATATLTNKTISGSANTLTDIGVSSLSATGTAGSTTYLRGDGSWATISIPQSATYTTAVGDGTSTAITVTHNLNTRNVLVAVKDASTYLEIECDVTATTLNAVSLAFATAPTTGQYTVTVFSDGAQVSATNTSWLSSSTIRDDTDQTKQVRFDVSGVTTGTTRTLTVPDANSNLVGTSATQTLTNKTISGSSNTISNVGVSSISATGTAGSSTFLRGDGSWATPPTFSTGKAIAMSIVFG